MNQTLAIDIVNSIRALSSTEQMAERLEQVIANEREKCARLIEQMPLAEILLAAGEMTSGERLLVKSLKNVFARKIRNQIEGPL